MEQTEVNNKETKELWIFEDGVAEVLACLMAMGKESKVTVGFYS